MCAPYGKNYIAHDDIPPEVQAAFERLQAVYGTQTARPTRCMPANNR